VKSGPWKIIFLNSKTLGKEYEKEMFVSDIKKMGGFITSSWTRKDIA
jgi:hypothetical protein